MKLTDLAAALLLSTVSVPAVQANHGVYLAESVPMASGEVRKIDKTQGKITIRHGPLTTLDMPAMTMVFRVKDPAMLDQVREGDKIKFVAERIDGAITVVEWQPAQ